MAGPLNGVRVVEVASHVFAPMAGAVLTEWGAEVVKVEHPGSGDPYRGLVTAGLHRTHGGVDISFLSANRGKRSLGLDLKDGDGRRLLGRLVARADVFVTNVRPAARRALRIDVGDVRADNPRVIYVRATAFGPDGPDADRGGYDAGAYWARSGMQELLTAPGARWPTGARAAFGDVVGGLTIAGAVGAALYQRATDGTPSVIDASLLASGMWQVQVDLMNAALDRSAADRPGPDGAATARAIPDRYQSPNPLMLPYRTADGRFVVLQMLASDRDWPALCRAVGQPAAATDPRFADADARRANSEACIRWLEEVFAGRDYAEWGQVLAGFAGEWAPVQTPAEVTVDPQVVANSYMVDVDIGAGLAVPVVTAPVRFDGRAGPVRRAPEPGEHTEEVLLELGLSWDDIEALKRRGVAT